jgi:hypothetical protein
MTRQGLKRAMAPETVIETNRAFPILAATLPTGK